MCTDLTSLFLQYKMSCDKYAESDNTKEWQSSLEYAIQLFLSIKHISWKHEKEYRIICPYYKEFGNRVSNATMGLSILDITIGLNCEEKYRQKILQFANAREIPCYQICLDNKNFLVREQLGGN